MSIRKSFDVTIRANSMAQAKDRAAEMVADGTISKVKVVVGENGTGGFSAYLDEAKDENNIGRVMNVLDESGTAQSLATLCEELYEIKIEKFEKNVFTGKFNLLGMKTEEKEAESKESDRIMSLIKEKIDAGIISKEEMRDILRYMKEELFDERLMYYVIKQYAGHSGKQPQRPSTLYKDPWLKERKAARKQTDVAEACRNALVGNAIILEGPKAVGKNVFTETIAWILHKPLYLITFSPNMAPSFIYGEKSTDNSAAEALAKFDPEILKKAKEIEDRRNNARMLAALARSSGANEAVVKMAEDSAAKLTVEEEDILSQAALFQKQAVQATSVNIVVDSSPLYDALADENGAMICFNEMNLAEPGFFASFTNQLTDGTGFINIPGRGEVKIHKGFCIVGTQNADYAGCQQQNEATVSRFGCIRFKQPKSIVNLLKVATMSKIRKDGFDDVEIPDEYVKQAADFYNAVYGASTRPDAMITNASLNIRGYVRALSVVAESNGECKLVDELQTQVINTCDPEEVEALMTMAKQSITC